MKFAYVFISVLLAWSAAMTQRISPIDMARMGLNNDLMSRATNVEATVAAMQNTDILTQNLADVGKDVWALNTSSPFLCQARLSLDSNAPVTFNDTTGNTIYLVPYLGNQVGMYNGSSWDSIQLSSVLSLPILQTQTGSTHNGTAVIDGLTDTSQLAPGMWVSGAGIPVGISTIINTIDSPTQVTINANATASASVAVTFKTPWSQDIDIFLVDLGGGNLALRFLLWQQRTTGGVTGVTNATPMVVTDATLAPSLTANSGQLVEIANVTGATGANSTWRVGAVTATTYTLLNQDGTNSAAGGVFTGAGQSVLQSQTGIARDVSNPISLQDGVYVLTANPSWRYMGSAHTTKGFANDTQTNRWLFNFCSRVPRFMFKADATATWNQIAANTWEPDHNNTTNRLEFMVGIKDQNFYYMKQESVTLNAQNAKSGINIDAAGNTAPGIFGIASQGAAANLTFPIPSTNLFLATANAGYHFLQGMQLGSAAAGVVWAGNGAHGLFATVMA